MASKADLSTIHKREKLLAKEPKPKVVGTGCAGLWRAATKIRLALMTDFIVANGLLPEKEVREIQNTISAQIISNQQHYQSGEEYLQWHDLLEMFTPEDALDEGGHNCISCHLNSA